MADKNKRLPGNVVGDFFVDSTCLNCDTCRQIAPETFIVEGNYAVVGKQPATAEEKRRANHAVLCCPNGSIGSEDRSGLKEVMSDFPIEIEDGVCFTGFNSLKTAGGNSYFVTNPQGNWLICCPKFQGQLVKRIEELGGLKYLFASHRDDVGEALKFKEKFGCTLIIHAEDLDALPTADIVISGSDPISIAGDFLVVPGPGHTEGHLFLLYKNRFLFSGDSFRYDRGNKRIDLWDPNWTWYDFKRQVSSVRRLLDYDFEWVLPTHGARVKMPLAEMKLQMKGAVDRAAAITDTDPETLYRWKVLRYYAKELRQLGQDRYAERIQTKADALKSNLPASG